MEWYEPYYLWRRYFLCAESEEWLPEECNETTKRAIQRELQDPLAMEVLSGSFKPGDHILVDTGDEGLEFQSTPNPILEPAV